MKVVKAAFCDGWKSARGGWALHFEETIRNILNKNDTELVVSKEPDFLFYSCFGTKFKSYKNCVKVFITGENVSPNFNECDYAVGFDHIKFDDRYLRYNYVYERLREAVEARKNASQSLTERKFCNFVYDNPDRGAGAVLRQDFAKSLMKYKHIDSPGAVLNNMKNAIVPRKDSWEEGKLKFIKDYKFTIAFENTSSIGYTTEKLVHPLLVNSIPIYWGNPEAARIFNPKAFVNCHDFEDFGAVIEKIIELDSDDEKYLSMLKEPLVQDDTALNYGKQFEDFILNIIKKGNKPFYKGVKWVPKNYTALKKTLADAKNKVLVKLK